MSNSTTPWKEITKYRSKDMMNPNAPAGSGSLREVDPKMEYYTNHVDSDDPLRWTGWSEKSNSGSNKGGAVRAVILSGSAGDLKRLHVDQTASIGGNTSIGGNLTVGGNTTIQGDLQVNGTASYINVQELYVKDKSITVASGSSTATAANGAGFNIAGANVNLQYKSGLDRMSLNKGFEVSGSLFVTSNLFVTGSATAASFSGDGSQLTNVSTKVFKDDFTNVVGNQIYEFNHNFNSKNIVVAVYELISSTPVQIIPEQIDLVDNNNVQIVFGRNISNGFVLVK